MPELGFQSRRILPEKLNHGLHGSKNKNVVRGGFEYSHSPDNRALTKPYPVTTYLVANRSCNQSLKIHVHRPSAHMQSSDPACQVLILNLIETCLFHQEHEFRLVRKLLHRRR